MTVRAAHVLAPLALNLGQQLQEVMVELHDDDVGNVEEEEDEGLVPLQLPVPGKPDEQHDGEAIDHRVSGEWAPVEVQDLPREDCAQCYDD